MDALKDRPAGLDASEVLAYRQGYSRGVAKYLKDNGTPALAGAKPAQDSPEYPAWRRELSDRTAAFRIGAHQLAHPYAMRSLAAYRKRNGIVIVDSTVKPKVTRKVRTKVNEDDQRTILIAVLKARLSGSPAVYEAALDTIMQTLNIAPAQEGVRAA